MKMLEKRKVKTILLLWILWDERSDYNISHGTVLIALLNKFRKRKGNNCSFEGGSEEMVERSPRDGW